MPNYIYKCNQCNSTKNIFMSIIKYNSTKNSIFCKCDDGDAMIRVYDDFSSDIEINPDELRAQIKKEAKEVVKKIIHGDSSLIDNIYGS